MRIEDFARYPTGNLCNANPAVRPLSPAIRALIPGKRVAGRARTARIAPGQNAAIHRAVHEAQPGDILVVDGAASERFGPFGDLLADCCKARGMAGGVFDCTIRDSADIAAIGFQVFARGFHPEATAKTDPGETSIAVTVGGVAVHPGDIVVGDDDGVVIVPAGIAAGVLEQVAAVAAREEAIRARILAGETTFDIFGLGGT
jgi:4-hydroxy-4-methyl-2-oxoglutarate aldolase